MHGGYVNSFVYTDLYGLRPKPSTKDYWSSVLGYKNLFLLSMITTMLLLYALSTILVVYPGSPGLESSVLVSLDRFSCVKVVGAQCS